MPYLVCIGAIPSNKSGVGSRGYHVSRAGRRVVRRWGAVEVTSTRKFHWCRKPQEREENCSSEGAARHRVLRITKILQDRDGYDQLPSGSRILRPRPRG